MIVCPRGRTLSICFLVCPPFTEWLLRTVSPYSTPDCPTVLVVRVSIPQSASGAPSGCNCTARRLPKESNTCSVGFKSREDTGQSIRVVSSLPSSR
ncbi:hypothetical protein TNCV_14541 [Trichonephila clavipes]|nr:hypothetical protein TNCV_14541 [Trichonephila clavipes]